MTAKDQLKLIKAGFTIIRKEGEEGFSKKKIKYKNEEQTEWATWMNGFQSNAEMQRAVDELLKIGTIVED